MVTNHYHAIKSGALIILLPTPSPHQLHAVHSSPFLESLSSPVPLQTIAYWSSLLTSQASLICLFPWSSWPLGQMSGRHLKFNILHENSRSPHLLVSHSPASGKSVIAIPLDKTLTLLLFFHLTLDQYVLLASSKYVYTWPVSTVCWLGPKSNLIFPHWNPVVS